MLVEQSYQNYITQNAYSFYVDFNHQQFVRASKYHLKTTTTNVKDFLRQILPGKFQGLSIIFSIIRAEVIVQFISCKENPSLLVNSFVLWNTFAVQDDDVRFL